MAQLVSTSAISQGNHAGRGRQYRGIRRYRATLVVTVAPAQWYLASDGLRWQNGQQAICVYPHVYDARVVALDGALGTQPSFVVAEVFNRFPIVAKLGVVFYGTLLFPIVMVAALETRRQDAG